MPQSMAKVLAKTGFFDRLACTLVDVAAARAGPNRVDRARDHLDPTLAQGREGALPFGQRRGADESPVLAQPHDEARAALDKDDLVGRFDVIARIHGGGITGQAGALRLGVARALNAIDIDANRPSLKKAGLLTRDARVIERKKAGLKKARKAPQYSKR